MEVGQADYENLRWEEVFPLGDEAGCDPMSEEDTGIHTAKK